MQSSLMQHILGLLADIGPAAEEAGVRQQHPAAASPEGMHEHPAGSYIAPGQCNHLACTSTALASGL